MGTVALAPVAGLVICVALHVMICRYRSVYIGPLGVLAVSVLGGGGLVTGLAVGAGQIGGLPVWLLTYLLLAYCYVIGLFNLGESSRRIRLLIELHDAPSQALTLEEILTRYNARMVVEARLRRLVTAGQLVECDYGRYYLIGNRTGLWIARALAALAPLLSQRRR